MTQTSQPPDGNSATRQLLFVDDSEPFRNAFAELLEISGYKVIEAGSGHEALDVVRDSSRVIDLLITDIVMPGMNGFELAEATRSLRPRLKILFVSGQSLQSVRTQGMSIEEADFLMKPFSHQDLVDRIESKLSSA
jgi:two-component system cell cycle sensor histidine kinase/response regulator CckA